MSIRNQKVSKHDFANPKPRQNSKQRRHGERNRERGRVPKVVHCAIQSKGKERRVRLNHTPFVPLPNLDPQTAEPTLTIVHFFFQFCRFGYKTLLLIEFFLLGRFRFDSFLFWVFGISIKRFVLSMLDICFCLVFCLFF